MITDTTTGTNIQEIGEGIYRINTPVAIGPGRAFNFNQYLVVDDEPVLFHTGQRGLFPVVQAAVASVVPIQSLRHIGLSHFEADECGALNSFLAAAPQAVPFCSQVAAMTSIGDFSDRPARALADGEEFVTGRRRFRWFYTPHVPHSWECGLLMEMTTRTFFCGDLFTQGGKGERALTTDDILEPSEAFRRPMDYFAHAPQTATVLDKLADQQPTTLACMHGSAWQGDGAGLLRALGSRLV
ncbi:oxygen-binding di-iron domain-containing protein [Peristeroidobacter soli]|jgi:flavorubredoxin|uniref:MBL fold metallo-hydrolase n=1 Tax=Peristeroidobacter soli TaxID=2497877 RepID=UPI00101B9687|nr:MBL fold metallo-hydrolase [Peristeroidobacter soli]